FLAAVFFASRLEGVTHLPDCRQQSPCFITTANLDVHVPVAFSNTVGHGNGVIEWSYHAARDAEGNEGQQQRGNSDHADADDLCRGDAVTAGVEVCIKGVVKIGLELFLELLELIAQCCHLGQTLIKRLVIKTAVNLSPGKRLTLTDICAQCISQLVDAACQRRIDLSHRSEEHTSELQSRENLVCRLLLEKIQ